jgi:hypothetical protein
LSTTAATPCTCPSSTSTGDATASDADHEHAGIDKQSQRRELDDRARLGRGHHPPVVRAVARDRPAALCGQTLGPRAVVNGADRLRRVREGRILAPHDHLGQQRRHASSGQRVRELLLEQVADHPLALGAEHVEGVGGK